MVQQYDSQQTEEIYSFYKIRFLRCVQSAYNINTNNFPTI